MARTLPGQWPLKLISAALAACFAQTVVALPSGASVASGSATFAQSGNTLTITNSNRAIINWPVFSIAPGETVRFDQAATSSVLNRVVGVTVNGRLVFSPSEILGALQSQGRVFLINPAGVLIGAGATVDVAGFVASSLLLSDADFLANRLQFTEVAGAGKVQNFGTIRTTSGGSVYLVAPNVENHGLITTPNGEVILAAGQRAELLDTGTPGVKVAVTAGGEALNVGQLMAESGRIGMVGAIVKQQGTISTDSVVREGGRIFLKASQSAELATGSITSANGTQGGSVLVESGDLTLVSGSVSATGSTGAGGRAELLGDKVGVLAGAVVDASGETGGGTVLVGGDYQGKNAAVRNATSTTFESNATLKADARNVGNGGTIVVWSDGTTSAYGKISARGGIKSGNGGFVEVSGKQHLIYRGLTDTSAPRGITGSLLLDPTSIGLIAGAGTDSGTTVYGDNIRANLGLSNVILQTSSGGTGNITFTAGTYDFSSATVPNSLTLLAFSDGSTSTGNISLPTGTLLTMKVGAPLKMVAGWDGASVTAPAVVAGFGDISAVAGSMITAQEMKAIAGGDITLNGANRVDSVDLKTTGGLVSYNTANANTTRISASATGDITVTGSAVSTSIALGNLTTTGAAAITVSAQGQILDDNGGSVANLSTGAGNITLTSQVGTPIAGTLAISADVSTTGGVTATVSGGPYGSIVIRDVGANQAGSVNLNASAASAEGNVGYFRDGNLNLAPSISLTPMAGVGTAAVGASGDINVTAAYTLNGAKAGILAGGDLNVLTTLTLNGADNYIAAAGNMNLTAGDVAMNGANSNTAVAGSTLSITGGRTLQAGAGKPLDVIAGAISLDNGTLFSGGDLMLVTPGDVTMINGSTLASGTGTLTFLANNMNVASGAVSAGQGIDGTLFGGLTLGALAGGTGTMSANNGIVDLAIGGTGIEMFNGSNINSTDATQPAGGLIKLFFAGISSGGSMIDGIPTFDGGYKVGGSTLASLGSGLDVSYGVLSNPVSDAMVSAMNSTTDSGGSTNETTPSLDLVGNTTTAGTDTIGTIGTQTIGGTEGTFGGDAGSASASGSSTGNNQDGNNAKKKPAQCGA